MPELILYTTEDGKSQIQLRAEQDTVWLTQLEMADLFNATNQNISLHLKNIFEDGELVEEATVKESLTVQTEGNREVKRPVTLYNLDAILAVGYRVRSPRGVQFRRWASTVLKEYLLKGFAMDDERLKNPDGRPDHFDEMLARIRDIRASEKRFYQKVRDLFALSSDYDRTDRATQQFFAIVQNLLLYAVTKKTASFFGYSDLRFCLRGFDDEALDNRALNLLSHGKYAIHEPVEMMEDNKELSRRILKDYLDRFEFDLPNILPGNAPSTS